MNAEQSSILYTLLHLFFLYHRAKARRGAIIILVEPAMNWAWLIE